MNNDQHPNTDIRNDRSISPLWILPLLSLVLAAWLIYGAINDAGTRITIEFKSAQGLTPGRTPIKYKGLDIGMVKKVALAENMNGISVVADIYPNAQHTLRDDTLFWLVKPQATIEGISGLDALVAGNYIALQPGQAANQATLFKALDNAPIDVTEGLPIRLTTDNLKGITNGSKIYYRRIPVGAVHHHRLSEDNQSVVIDAVIHSPYEDLVKENSHFWNISGISTQIDTAGIDIKLEGLSALVLGGIAFDSPPNGKGATDSTFVLYPDIQAAGRGVSISIELPQGRQVKQDTIVYQNVPIGKLTERRFNPVSNHVVANGVIDAEFSHLLTNNSYFLIEEAELSFQHSKNISNLIFGDFLHLIASENEGEPSTHFIAASHEDLFFDNPEHIEVTLYSDNTFGVSRGTAVKHRGINVGQVKSSHLDNNRIKTVLVIDNRYAHLLRKDNQFYVDSGLQASLTADGVNVDILPFHRLIQVSLSFTSKGAQGLAAHYQLYPTKQAATTASNNQYGTTRYQVIHKKKPGFDAGSPVFYRDIKVGKISEYVVNGDNVIISLDINNAYTYLIDDQTIFWNYSGVTINAGLTGFNIEAGPVQTLLNGGIAFDKHPNTQNKQQGYFRLFDTEQQARQAGIEITFTAQDGKAISRSTPIRYHGVTVGEVLHVEPNFAQGNIQINATIYPEYSKTVAQKDSYFWLVKPKLSLTQSENLESLLTTYIAVQPGSSGDSAQQFQLNERAYQQKGVSLNLQAHSTYDISIGSPVLYRQLQVGEVSSVELGQLSDRIDIGITIYTPYQHLVRSNTRFWNQSGLEVNIGLTGASVQAGTLNSIIKGGISFATPPGPLKAQADNLSPFFLHEAADPTWMTWNPAIPR
ncbi:MlaD family protein [Thaumasiovibrio sp. DFM-14]|uniref:PqiB family protein n=1 Tax=Thaumasiovibrio sp. DFM-14 TaxID=3384792 RepID=UPI0039A0FBBB